MLIPSLPEHSFREILERESPAHEPLGGPGARLEGSGAQGRWTPKEGRRTQRCQAWVCWRGWGGGTRSTEAARRDKAVEGSSHGSGGSHLSQLEASPVLATAATWTASRLPSSHRLYWMPLSWGCMLQELRREAEGVLRHPRAGTLRQATWPWWAVGAPCGVAWGWQQGRDGCHSGLAPLLASSTWLTGDQDATWSRHLPQVTLGEAEQEFQPREAASRQPCPQECERLLPAGQDTDTRAL